MKMSDKLCDREQRYRFNRRRGVREGIRTGLDIYREEKKFLPLPGLKPRIAEPIIPVSMSTMLSRLQYEKYSFEICITYQEVALNTRYKYTCSSCRWLSFRHTRDPVLQSSKQAVCILYIQHGPVAKNQY
jgi:hypothetical protein